MKRKSALLVLIFLFILVMLASALVLLDLLRKSNTEVNTRQIITVKLGESIQEAINQAHERATIFIESGVHMEDQYPIVINKTVSIVGENVDTTVIDGTGTDKGILKVKSNGVEIKNLTIKNTFINGENAGIHILNVKDTWIMECKLEDCMIGILLENSSSTTIARNHVLNNRFAGIYLRNNCTSNVVIGNNITNNMNGIRVADPTCVNNRFYHNNFINNTSQTSLSAQGGKWDDGYPSGGNYWSDYIGFDLKNGPNQDQLGSDGIGDTPYQWLDGYPFMGPLCYFNAGKWNENYYYIIISSNSTISDFNFSPENEPSIRFNLSSLVGKTSFCRVTVPKQLLWVDFVENWTVTVNGEVISFFVIDYSQLEQAYFYFDCSQESQTVKISGTHVVPEFSIIIFLLVAFLSSEVMLVKIKVKEKRRKMGS